MTLESCFLVIKNNSIHKNQVPLSKGTCFFIRIIQPQCNKLDCGIISPWMSNFDLSGSYKDKKVAFKKAPQNFLIVGVKLDRANRVPSLLTRLAQMFSPHKCDKTALCYSAHSHSGDNMASHKSVGAHRVSPHLYLYFFIGRENPSPTDTNCFDSKMATLGISKS